MVVSIHNVGGLIGNFAMFPMSEKFGIKRAIHCMCIPLIVSSWNSIFEYCRFEQFFKGEHSVNEKIDFYMKRTDENIENKVQSDPKSNENDKLTLNDFCEFCFETIFQNACIWFYL